MENIKPQPETLDSHSKWIQIDPERVENIIETLQLRIESKPATPTQAVILEFQQLINTNPVVRMYITQMIQQIPTNPKYNKHPIKNIKHLLTLLNEVLTVAPDFNHTLLVGTPFSAILIWTMGTPAGFSAYRYGPINTMFKKILTVWQSFLNSEKSLYVINDSAQGWKSKAAQKKLKMYNYQYNANDPHWGFHSWNDFFTRQLADGARPIKEPNNSKVIVSACDSTVYKIVHNIKKYSQFWVKDQPYSLNDMLANDELSHLFIGGSVYQAFLNPFNYHRWHSPVSGIVKKAYVQNGLYFSQANSEGEDPNDQDLSEAYISQVQTRAIIFIECDDTSIGTICVMPIGMVEISTCIIHDTIKPGYTIKKGEELGYFQFGGSSHCVIFQAGVIKTFLAKPHSFYQVGQQIAEAY